MSRPARYWLCLALLTANELNSVLFSLCQDFRLGERGEKECNPYRVKF